MKFYCVGGAIRDELLGLPVKDRDWVVVGGTPEALVERGFRPVGKDFPVFLHPQTREEYALARTERKAGRGYRGFTVHYAPDVSLQDDLRRRDLTINAIARDEQGSLIDPHGGLRDLNARVLRHVSDAFCEDPVRILRVARFAARFTEFTVAPQTAELMRRMVADGEVNHLVAERVWQELAKGLMEARPSRMFEVLRDCAALERILPELNRLWGVSQSAVDHPEVDAGVHAMMVIDLAAREQAALAVRFAALTHDLGKGERVHTPTGGGPDTRVFEGHEERSQQLVEALCTRLRIPGEVRDIARLTAREHGLIHKAAQLPAAALVQLLERLDALRRPARLELVLAACSADWRGRLGMSGRDYPPSARLTLAQQAARSVDAGSLAAIGGHPDEIRARIHQHRVAAVSAALGD